MKILFPSGRVGIDANTDIKMTPEQTKAWAAERLTGHQFNTGYGPVYCPSRKSQWEEK